MPRSQTESIFSRDPPVPTLQLSGNPPSPSLAVQFGYPAAVMMTAGVSIILSVYAPQTALRLKIELLTDHCKIGFQRRDGAVDAISRCKVTFHHHVTLARRLFGASYYSVHDIPIQCWLCRTVHDGRRFPDTMAHDGCYIKTKSAHSVVEMWLPVLNDFLDSERRRLAGERG
jgi:hypothetical protein